MAKRKAYPLRMDEKILEAMQRLADDELRSVNAQIEYVCRQALREAGRLPQGSADPQNDVKSDVKSGDDSN